MSKSIKGEKIKKVYDNADTCKDIFLRDNKGKTGIYRWLNVVNDISYIGSSIDIRERFIRYYNINHLMDNYCMLICRALVKYGYSKFNLEILEYCQPKERFARENHYIKEYHSLLF